MFSFEFNFVIFSENTRVAGLGLTQQDKEDIIAFLKTITDRTLENNPEFQE